MRGALGAREAKFALGSARATAAAAEKARSRRTHSFKTPPARTGWRLNTGVGAGYVGILSAELHFPAAGSLKGKRKYVKSAKAQLQQRFGAAVAEVDHHELWQRSRLTLSCVARDHRELEALLDGAERYLAGQEFELVGVEREIVSLED